MPGRPNRDDNRRPFHAGFCRTASRLRRSGLTLIIAATLLGGTARAADTIADYDATCQKLLTAQRSTWKNFATKGDLYYYYSFSYVLDGLAAIYEATGRDLYLQTLIEFALDITAKGQDTVHTSGKGAGTKDGYLDYYHSNEKAWDYSPNNTGHWTIMRSVARIARLGRLGPHYAANKASIDKIIAFIAKHAIEKWELGNQTVTITGYVAGPNTISYAASMGGLLVDAYLATGNMHYRDLATLYASKLKQKLVLFSNGSYAWSADGSILLPKDYAGKNYNVQDASHANRVLRFADIAYRASLVLTSVDMQRLATTFNKNLWRGDPQRLNDYVNGLNVGGTYGGLINEGWILLGAYDPTVRQRMLIWGRRHDIEFYGHLANTLKLSGGKLSLAPPGTPLPDAGVLPKADAGQPEAGAAPPRGDAEHAAADTGSLAALDGGPAGADARVVLPPDGDVPPEQEQPSEDKLEGQGGCSLGHSSVRPLGVPSWLLLALVLPLTRRRRRAR